VDFAPYDLGPPQSLNPAPTITKSQQQKLTISLDAALIKCYNGQQAYTN